MSIIGDDKPLKPLPLRTDGVSEVSNYSNCLWCRRQFPSCVIYAALRLLSSALKTQTNVGLLHIISVTQDDDGIYVLPYFCWYFCARKFCTCRICRKYFCGQMQREMHFFRQKMTTFLARQSVEDRKYLRSP